MLDSWIGRGESGGDIRDKSGRRPVIGLALGGGAARGFAHIGIVKTLAAHGIVPDVVVGTSIGAVVGGAFAAGHLHTLEQWARGLQPRSVFSYLDLKLNGSGLIGGNKLAAELEASIGQTLIEELPLKFAAVATEVRTGHETWLTHGRVVDAMRASYALPGIFAPVLIGERWLVDGALVNPVPVWRRGRWARKSSSPPTFQATSSLIPPRSTPTARPPWRAKNRPILHRGAVSASSFRPSARSNANFSAAADGRAFRP